MILQMDALDFLDSCLPVDLIFCDPPDNIGLKYGTYVDKRDNYYDWIELIVLKSLRVCDTFWLSYYWKHDLEIKHRVRNILQYRHPLFQAKTMIWRYTFGQHKETDCGSGFRYLLRLSKFTAFTVPRIESARQRLGDQRANPLGRVPDDVWEFPRVVGNAAERRPWHPTQHPEALVERIVRMSEPSVVVDLCAGTGTMARVCARLDVMCLSVEIDPVYASRIAHENEQILRGNPMLEWTDRVAQIAKYLGEDDLQKAYALSGVRFKGDDRKVYDLQTDGVLRDKGGRAFRGKSVEVMHDGDVPEMATRINITPREGRYVLNCPTDPTVVFKGPTKADVVRQYAASLEPKEPEPTEPDPSDSEIK